MLKRAIVIVSFGTSYSSACSEGILPIEQAVQDVFYDCKVVRAFISARIRSKLKERDSVHVDSPAEAIESLLRHGYDDIILQPTLVVPGREYEKLQKLVEEYGRLGDYIEIRLGKPLLHSDSDMQKITDCLVRYKRENYPDANLVLMGHGTEHYANSIYFRLLSMIQKEVSQVYLTLIDSSPTFSDVVDDMVALGVSSVVLKPLTIVAGGHVLNDMASDECGSLSSLFRQEGIEVEPVLEGIGGYREVHEVFVKHIADMVDDVVYNGLS